GHGQLAGQIEMTKAIECLQRGETIITVDMLRRFTRDSSSGMAEPVQEKVRLFKTILL
ncbi:MAG: hypothetical protein EZS28_024521, partial [Streblomastix strix]